MTILILHGWKGSEAGHWQSWLASELSLAGADVYFPELPSKESPCVKDWVEFVYRYFAIRRIDVVVCHSLANLLWLHLIDLHPDVTCKKLFMVAPCSFRQPFPHAKSFFPPPSVNLAGHSEQIMLVLSNDDPSCPFIESMEIEKTFAVPTLRLSGVGHINTESGFGKWPLAKRWILEDSLGGRGQADDGSAM
jgi:predicted alpha/beta hydrolase family esterase